MTGDVADTDEERVLVERLDVEPVAPQRSARRDVPGRELVAGNRGHPGRQERLGERPQRRALVVETLRVVERERGPRGEPVHRVLHVGIGDPARVAERERHHAAGGAPGDQRDGDAAADPEVAGVAGATRLHGVDVLVADDLQHLRLCGRERPRQRVIGARVERLRGEHGRRVRDPVDPHRDPVQQAVALDVDGARVGQARDGRIDEPFENLARIEDARHEPRGAGQELECLAGAALRVEEERPVERERTLLADRDQEREVRIVHVGRVDEAEPDHAERRAPHDERKDGPGRSRARDVGQHRPAEVQLGTRPVGDRLPRRQHLGARDGVGDADLADAVGGAGVVAGTGDEPQHAGGLVEQPQPDRTRVHGRRDVLEDRGRDLIDGHRPVERRRGGTQDVGDRHEWPFDSELMARA